MIVRGDFSQLADDYAKYRPSYSQTIAKVILGLSDRPRSLINAADIGAGTGIWSRVMQKEGVSSLFAVEPNDEMRSRGEAVSSGITWIKGTAEKTTLKTQSLDLVSMASAFHWADTDSALNEFHRILRPGGILALLWNPRLTEKSREETCIQNILENKYNVRSRVSSGRQGITTKLTRILSEKEKFSDVMYCEAEHSRNVTREQYIGTWRSVNDVRNQLGEVMFGEFLKEIMHIVGADITVHYTTRAWVARAS